LGGWGGGGIKPLPVDQPKNQVLRTHRKKKKKKKKRPRHGGRIRQTGGSCPKATKSKKKNGPGPGTRKKNAHKMRKSKRDFPLKRGKA